MIPLEREPDEHGHVWGRRGVIKQTPVLFCTNRGCRVVWWGNRRCPASMCKGKVE